MKVKRLRPKKVEVIGTKLKVKGKLCNKFDSGGKWDQSGRNEENVI